MFERRANRNARLPARILQAVWLLLLAFGAATQTAKAQVPSYSARYQIENRGRIVGMTEFEVSHDERRDVYTFSSRSRARGLLRLFDRRIALERSDFIVEDGRIRPLEYRFEDGLRKDDSRLHMVFDWGTSVVTVDSARGVIEFDLSPGVLDRGAMQVALMRDIETNGRPGPYTVIGEEDLSTYDFVRRDDAEITTPAGTFTTQRFLQQRDGSSRSTLVWVVPELRYLPAAIEQYRDGELNTRMVLESVEGLGTDGDGP